MSELYDPFNALKKFKSGKFYSLPALEEAGVGKISRLPVSIRVVLESVLRNCDGKKITEEDVKTLANWNAKKPSPREIPFVVSRILLQDFTGVPLVVDLATMRDAVAEVGKDPKLIEPHVPLDLVIDHSIQVDEYGTPMAFRGNVQKEFERNRERYEFLKWGQEAFETFQVVPPAVGICHQVNLEYLARLVFEKKINNENLYYLDTLVGTDSHTTMINGLGVVGWGVGGIEAEAGMLGQPVYFQTPEVIGVHMIGALREGVTATDLTLNITQLLRNENVVGKFVEFFGKGAESLTVADRATIGNMAPEYGATIGIFPIDRKTTDYLLMTGRSKEHVEMVEEYCKAQGIWGMPRLGEVDYTKVIELDLASVEPCVAGPKRPQDRINLSDLKEKFVDLFQSPVKEGGYGRNADTYEDKASIKLPKHGDEKFDVKNGSVLIAAITSCTNTSNPSVMVAAGLVAKKAVEKGLKINPLVKTSLAPGSRVVTDYLAKTGLQNYLDQLGFNLVGYGCTTCIGNSGPLEPEVEKAIKEKDLVAASVLSGNRNFEARIQPAIRANFLMSPPLVVAFALAGKVDIDFGKDPLGKDKDGKEVYLKDIWPTNKEIHECVVHGIEPKMFLDKYSAIDDASPEWNAIEIRGDVQYNWDPKSTYIQKPPYFDDFSMQTKPVQPIKGMRALAILGDSVTTDHVSPAGAIAEDGPAGKYLKSLGVEKKDFNSYGSRRGNDKVMTRGTFGNVRIKNQMAQGKEGGYTTLMPSGKLMSIYDAAMAYQKENVPLIVLSGNDYGMGSSRDWAAKGTLLLGVKVVVAKNFERIHRSNLIGMGVLPLQFKEGESVESWGLDGTETYSLPDFDGNFEPGDEIKMEISRINGKIDAINLIIRIDTHIEKEYYKHGGILPYVLRNILRR